MIIFPFPLRSAFTSLFLVLLILTGCNQIPNATITGSKFQETDKNPFRSLSSKGYFLNFVRYSYGFDTVYLAGVKNCTTLVNGSVTVVAAESLYQKTVILDDTIVETKNGWRGGAWLNPKELSMKDILSLAQSKDTSFAGELLNTYLDSSLLSALRQWPAGQSLPDSLKVGILLGFNTLKDDLGFYKTYHNRFVTPMSGNSQLLFNRLRAKSIFRDDSGTVMDPPLSVYATEEIRWFNISLLSDRIFSDQVRQVIFFFKVFPVVVTRGTHPNQMNQDTVIRYLEPTDTALYQIAFSNQDGWHEPTTTRMMPHTFSTEEAWVVTPLFWTPLFSGYEDQNFYPKIVSSRAKIMDVGMDLTGKTLFNWNNYYSLDSTFLLDGQSVPVNGSLSVNLGYQFDGLNILKSEANQSCLTFLWPTGNRVTKIESVHLVQVDRNFQSVNLPGDL